jgi:DNA-binding CsgD family transcriptional regulator/tetratricopeptide (TPR) repeat protein
LDGAIIGGVPRRVSSPEFVGRTEELTTLLNGLERAGARDASAIFVAGEAGVGKTRLVDEFTRRAEGDGARLLRGDCVVLADGELPFAPLTAALRPLVRELDPGELDEPARAELARVIPELGLAGSGPDGSDSSLDEPLAQSRLFELLLGLLGRLGDQAPLVLIIEDLHWADRSTREFLSFLIRNARDAPLLLVCTYRSDELHRRHPLRPFLAEEERRGPVERLELRRLTEPELARLVSGILGASPDAELVRRLHERSEGNPFFAEELLAATTDARGPLPPSVRDAFMVRVEALSVLAQGVLRIAAVAGRRTSHRLIAAVATMPDARLLEALREAVASNVLVQQDDTYEFRHALLRESVYTDLLPGERTSLHLRLAEVLAADQSLGDGSGVAAAAELAHHFWAARRLPEALRASVEAGRAAERSYAFAEAQRHFEAALEIWDRVEEAEQLAGCDRAAVTARAAENAHLVGDQERAVALAREAISELDRASDAVRAALQRERLGRYLWTSGDPEASEQAYSEALEMLPPEPPTAELARVLAAYAQILMLRGRPREARGLCERAISVAREVGARAQEGHALNTLGVIIGGLGDREAGDVHLRTAQRIAEEVGTIDDRCRVYVNRSDQIDQDGRVEEAAELALEGAEVARGLGARSYSKFLQGEAAHRLLRLGRLAEAERLASEAPTDEPSGLTQAILRHARAEADLIRGDLDSAAGELERAETPGGKADSMWLGPLTASRIDLELQRGRPEEAAATAEAAAAAMGEGEIPFFTSQMYKRGLSALAEVAERARALADPETLADAQGRAERMLDRLRGLLAPEHWDGTPPPASLGHLAAAEAEMSRVEGDSDPSAWSSVAARWEELGLPLELAYAQWRQAEAILLSDGDRGAAAELLSSAAAAASAAGAEPLLEGVESLARRARLPLSEKPTREVEEGVATDGAESLGLTDRELEVLELVAEGKTNREIGETLFISAKTASVHVSRILAKLDVRGRVEAATAAHRLGITRDAADDEPG